MAIIWVRRYRAVTAHIIDDDEWAEAWVEFSDDDGCHPEGVELTGFDAGLRTFLDHHAADNHPLVEAVRDDDTVRRPPRSIPTTRFFAVCLRHPVENIWGTVSRHVWRETAEDVAAKLTATVGDHRVQVREVTE